jgi:hypothetical protein
MNDVLTHYADDVNQFGDQNTWNTIPVPEQWEIIEIIEQ